MGQTSCVHNLEEHDKEIYTIKWSPRPEKKLLLARYDAGGGVVDSMMRIQGGARFSHVQQLGPIYVCFTPRCVAAVLCMHTPECVYV